jgi:hypothetical protein
MAVSAAAQGPKNRIAAPTNVTVSSTIAALIVDWTPVTGAASYLINYRQAGSTIVMQLGQAVAPQFQTRPPVPGMAFEYQVVAVAPKQHAPSAWVPYTVPVQTQTVTAVVMPATTTGTITPMTLGPATLTVTANASRTQPGIGYCSLSWPLAPPAVGYRIMRASPTELEHSLTDMTGAAVISDANGYLHFLDKVSTSVVYSYRVFGILADNTVTLPSPTATCTLP